MKTLKEKQLAHDPEAALHYSAKLYCFFANDATISGLQLSFLIQQHEGKRMLYEINCGLNFKCETIALSVSVYISGQFTAPSSRRILSNFQI